MSATNYSNVWKNCATCDCWEGTREVNASGDTVTLDSSTVGRCTGFWEGSKKFGNDKCTEWKMWRKLSDEKVFKRSIWPPID